MSIRETTEKLDLNLKYAFEHNVNFRQRIITINTEIDDDTFALIDTAMSEMEAYSRQAITIRISSEGGEVYAALAIVGRIKNSHCKIITEGYGKVMSAATLVFSCGNERRISNFAQFMYHESAYDLEGRHSQIKQDVKQKEREEELWALWMENFSKKPRKWYLEQSKHTDKYWTPEELVEYGIADKII